MWSVYFTIETRRKEVKTIVAEEIKECKDCGDPITSFREKETGLCSECLYKRIMTGKKGGESSGMAAPVTNENLSSRFWDKWYNADELDRLKLVQQLTGMDDRVTAVLTNSYLTDLAECLEEKLKKG